MVLPNNFFIMDLIETFHISGTQISMVETFNVEATQFGLVILEGV